MSPIESWLIDMDGGETPPPLPEEPGLAAASRVNCEPKASVIGCMRD